MNLFFNNLDLATLGALRITGRSTRREPVEAPQRERIEYRVRLDFFEQAFATNFNQIQRLQTALATNSASLLWQDDGGQQYVSRPVTAGDDEVPRDVLEKGGTHWQAIEFSFWYYNHAVTSNTLNGSFTRSGGVAQDLGAIENWREALANERFDPLRDVRKLVVGTVTASGRWQADTTANVAQRQVALAAKKDSLLAELRAAATGNLTYGTFNQSVRVTEFAADVNQPQNFVAWTASFTFTRYPNEADYALVEYSLSPRKSLTEGINYLSLTGKIQAPTEAAARTRLAALQTSVIPAGYALANTQSDARTVGSETTGGGDGLTFIELTFSLEYRDRASVGLTVQRPGGALLDMGTVDKFRDGTLVTRFSEFRDVRSRAAGQVTMSGRWYVGDNLTVAQQQAALAAQLIAFRTELVAQKNCALVYGSIFNQTVRVTEFTADIDKLTNSIAWSLAATFTRYPDETDYALIEYTVAPHLNVAEGIAYLSLAGKIQAASEAAARARMATLQASGIVSANFALLTVQSSAQNVGSETTGGSGDGLTFTELTFSFEYRDTGTLAATYQNLGGSGGGTYALGTVDKFRDHTSTARFDEFRDVRKRTAGDLAMSGRWYVSDALTPAQQQAALIAQQQTLLAQVTAGNRGRLTYAGIFDAVVRVTEFTAEINRLTNCIEWSLTATYTRYPNESDYAQIELRVTRKENKAEGVQYLTLSGKVMAPSEAAANARLTTQTAAIVPSTFALLETDVSPATVVSESGGVSDGAPFLEISFTLAYRETAGITCTYQRQSGGAAVDLGTVDKFASKYQTTLFDELRSVRKRTAGSVSLSGKWYAPESLSDAAKQALLLTQKASLEAEIIAAGAGQLTYGSAFSAVVRVLDFNAEVNRLRNCIDWSLSAGYTLYPNEADYAVAELSVSTRENPADGTVFKTLGGRIGAQTPEAAYAKLARLRTTFIPAGYSLQSTGTEERRVSTENNLTTSNNGDGDAFIELTINDVFQKTAGNVLEWSLRTATDDDVKSPTIRKVYSGNVRASAGTQPAAFAAAAAMADTLGNNKYTLLVRTNIVSLDKLFQTSNGQVFVTVEFSYDYEIQNDNTYFEVRCERAVDMYGQTTDTVSGFVNAPSLALALVCYTNNVRTLGVLAGGLILSERTPSVNVATLVGSGSLDQRFDFSLQLLRTRSSGTQAIRYDVQTTPDFRTLELATTIAGTVYGATQAEAEAFLQTVLAGLALTGKVTNSARTPHTRSGPQITGAGAGSVFESMDFSVTYLSLFTGVSGILECEVTEDVLYSGNRNVEKTIPDGPSIIQQAGITLGGRVVSARCRATTRGAADAWVRTMRVALLASLNGSGVQAYEDPARVSTRYGFLPQTAGVVSGGGANVTVYETSATFSEKIPELVFS